jgi:hypothetical protein
MTAVLSDHIGPGLDRRPNSDALDRATGSLFCVCAAEQPNGATEEKPEPGFDGIKC